MSDEEKTYYICKMHISDYQDNYYLINISLNSETSLIKYNPQEKDLIIENNSKLDKILSENKYQLQKILNNKRPDTFYIDFRLKFILRNNIEAVNFNDLTKIVVLDRKNNQYLTYTHQEKDKNICRIYTDGCYLEKHKSAAYAFIVKNSNNKLDLHTGKIDTQSSSLTELIAVIKALEYCKNIDYLRIISDSRYIIKGLTEWIFNWKLNNWHTAQGEKVKNIEFWKQFDELSKEKYIEFEWVKSHREHFENSLCDFYAKQKAMQ
jgi:ribonuclease HI